MSLYSRSLVRNLRRRARVESKLHPQWKVEARAARKAARRVGVRNFRWIVPLIAIGVAASDTGAQIVLPVLLAWSVVLMLARGAEIQSRFFLHAESTPFIQFPVTERFVFEHAAWRLGRSSLWLALDAFVLLAVAALQVPSLMPLGGVLLFAAVSAIGIWAATLAGAIPLVWLRPRFPFGKVSGFAFTFGFIGLFVAGKAGLLTPAGLRSAYESAKWFLPTGWVCLLIEPWLHGGRAISLAPLAFLAALSTAAVVGARRLRAGFVFWERHADLVSEGGDEDALEPVPIARVSEVEDAIASRSFLAPRDWMGSGFIERTAARWLTPREQRVMDLALVAAPGWTRRYPHGCALVLASPAFAWLALRTRMEPLWILGIGLLLGLGLITPLFGGNWTAFTLIPLANRATAICNLCPVTLREIRGCVRKLNLVRYLFALPWWLIAGGASGAVLEAGLFSGVVIAGKFWLIAFALQPFFLAFKCSASTNDTNSGCLFILAFFGLSFAVAAAGLTAMGLSFFAEKSALWLLATVALAVLSWLFEAGYRRAWRAQQFDLLAKSGGVPVA